MFLLVMPPKSEVEWKKKVRENPLVKDLCVEVKETESTIKFKCSKCRSKTATATARKNALMSNINRHFSTHHFALFKRFMEVGGPLFSGPCFT